MIGSGVFLLPASLAPFGGVSLAGWLVTTVGSLLLALVFARLARRLPAAGGPYVYAREAFGDFAGFLVGWTYWICCWTAVAAIAVAMSGYLGALVPGLSGNGAAAATASAAIVLLTAVNVAGVRQAAWVQVATTLIKVLPLVAIIAFGLPRLVPAHFTPFNPGPGGTLAALQATVALTLWAFVGLEAATVPAESVRDARRIVPRATLAGVSIAAALYVLGTTAVMGMVPRETLAASTAPFADAARALWGQGAARLVAAGAFVSCFGALNGWILCQGQVPMAVARDGLLPPWFARLTGRGTPAGSIAVSSALAVALVLANHTRGLVGMFTWVILLSTLATLVAYVFDSMAYLMLEARDRARGSTRSLAGTIVLASAAFAYSLVACVGAGREAVFWGFLLLVAGIPLYVAARWRSGR
jgi:APA family basic amino acid/polyamine antiporter